MSVYRMVMHTVKGPGSYQTLSGFIINVEGLSKVELAEFEQVTQSGSWLYSPTEKIISGNAAVVRAINVMSGVEVISGTNLTGEEFLVTAIGW